MAKGKKKRTKKTSETETTASETAAGTSTTTQEEKHLEEVKSPTAKKPKSHEPTEADKPEQLEAVITTQQQGQSSSRKGKGKGKQPQKPPDTTGQPKKPQAAVIKDQPQPSGQRTPKLPTQFEEQLPQKQPFSTKHMQELKIMPQKQHKMEGTMLSESKQSKIAQSGTQASQVLTEQLTSLSLVGQPRRQQPRDIVAPTRRTPQIGDQAVRDKHSSPVIEPKLTQRRTGGKNGRSISLITNHFPLKLGDIKQAVHYDVAIEPDRPKKLFRAVMEEFRQKFYSKRYPAFDGNKNLYSATPLPFANDELTGEVIVTEDERQKTFKVTVKYAADVDLTVINRYVNQNGGMKIPQRALQCLDVVLRSASALNCIPCGRSFFTRPSQTYRLGDGSELYYGFYQSAILGWKPFLNVDIVHKAFPMPMNIIELIKDMFGDTNLLSGIQPRELETLNKHLRTLKVQYEIPGQPGSRRVYRVNELDVPAARAEFHIEERNERTTVQRYYQTDKGVALRYPNLPCLWVGARSREKKILLPSEFCTVLSGQAVNRKMTENQTRNMIKKAATNTQTRLNNIQESVHHANYNRQNTVREFGLSVSEHPHELRGRVLKPPDLKYREKTERVFKGTWKASSFECGVKLETWTILNCDRFIRPDKLNDLERQIINCGNALGMAITQATRPFVDLRSAGKRLLEDLRIYFNNKKDHQLIVVIISNAPFVYNYVKQASELAVGCLTQCIKSYTVSNRLNRSTIDNILLKINAKRNGLNHSLDVTPPCLVRPCIIMGADVTHPSPDAKEIPSVAAVTASYERKAFKYNFCWRLQDPTMEIIGDLEAITTQHLMYFYKMNKGIKPERIIFFRDGVSDGQFEEVLRVELGAIRKACAGLSQDYKPKISFLVVQKRHHTRFFPKDQRDSEDRNCNVPAGTCVDTEITHPAAQDFYLVSHASIQGVAKPTKYRTLWDDADMCDDEIEQLTYYLCHLFARCTRSVSYPAPTYYAHLAAARAKVYCETERIDMRNLQREEQRLKVQECIIKDLPMFFV